MVVAVMGLREKQKRDVEPKSGAKRSRGSADVCGCLVSGVCGVRAGSEEGWRGVKMLSIVTGITIVLYYFYL